jgi:hypothetical protein
MMSSRRRKVIISDGGQAVAAQPAPMPPQELCKPFILLVSFLLCLNFALLGHLTITGDASRYYREWFPEAFVASTTFVWRSQSYYGDGRGEERQKRRQRKGDTTYESEDEVEEERSREWKLEGPIITGTSSQEKLMRVPSSFYRYKTDKDTARGYDVNVWWERKRQQQQLNDGVKSGKIALIMSYPNSGTSYTSKLVRMASGTTTATNYGFEGLISAVDYKSVPVYNYSLDGPYWIHPPSSNALSNSSVIIDDVGTEIESEEKRDTKRHVLPIPPPSSSILTKTHCGIRCTHCPPYMYMENEETFFQRCLSGSRKVPDHITKNNQSLHDSNYKIYYKKEYVTYSSQLINSIIHLIRNPFDNAISRFHHEIKEHAKNPTKYTKWLERYPRDKVGFRKWCNDENTMYGKFEREQFNWTMAFGGYHHTTSSSLDDVTKYFEGVTCHAEMVRYTLWHKLAIHAAERLDVPVLYVYYEDYAVDLEGETDKLLGFLNLTRRERSGGGVADDNDDEHVNLPEFRQSNYSDYFTLEERAATSDLIKRILKSGDSYERKGIELLGGYFTEWDFGKLLNQTMDII